jgi:hypothetical protein
MERGKARRVIESTIGQTILDSGNPPLAFLEMFDRAELPAWQHPDEGIEKFPTRQRAIFRGLQTTQESAQRR